MRRRTAIAALALMPLAFATRAEAQTAADAAAEQPPRLKVSPILEPPAARPATAQQATKPGTPQITPADRDAIFLRADRLEGEGQKWIEAEGNVELRGRRQTVLADW